VITLTKLSFCTGYHQNIIYRHKPFQKTKPSFAKLPPLVVPICEKSGLDPWTIAACCVPPTAQALLCIVNGDDSAGFRFFVPGDLELLL